MAPISATPAKAIATEVAHTIAYIHLPVSLPRATAAFFAPMRDFRLAPDTKIYM